MRSRGLLWIALSACAGQSPRVTQLAPTSQASAQQQHVGVALEGGCVQVLVMDGGAEKGTACASDARAKGLTIVDLTDAWTPTLFAPTGDQVPAIHDRYLELAAEKGQGEDALGELYGVVPALAIVRSRLADDSRHACHASIDPRPILALDRNYTQDDRETVAQHMAWRETLDRQRDKLSGDKLERLARLDAEHLGLVTMEQELRCEGAREVIGDGHGDRPRIESSTGAFTCTWHGHDQGLVHDDRLIRPMLDRAGAGRAPSRSSQPSYVMPSFSITRRDRVWAFIVDAQTSIRSCSAIAAVAASTVMPRPQCARAIA